MYRKYIAFDIECKMKYVPLFAKLPRLEVTAKWPCNLQFMLPQCYLS